VRISIWLCLLLLLTVPARAAEDFLAPYREPARRIVGEALLSDEAYQVLGELCDRYGHRLSGSENLEAAVDWAVASMEAQGLENVRREEVMVPRWVRGEERGWIQTPTTRHELGLLGLGMSVGTPPGGITAEVIVVNSFDEVDSLGEEGVGGRIVLYDVPFEGYGKTVRYRTQGASHAARHGAVAALVRSVGPMSYDTPHTGTLRYDDDAPKIPAAAVTIESATLLHRLQDRGDSILCHLEMGARYLGEVPGANVVGELVGRELPEEIVVVGGHLDSWDVGQGAQDDGAGCIIAWEAAHLLKRLGLRPRRTVRVVLFTNEENGLAGGTAYRDLHEPDLDHHVAALESDSGNGLADGFRVDLRPLHVGEGEQAGADVELRVQRERERAVALLDRFAPLFEPLGSSRFFPSYSGADVGPMVAEGVAGLGLNHDTTKYWEIHHTEADTFEKIVREDLNVNVAGMALMVYLLAEMPERLRAAGPE